MELTTQQISDIFLTRLLAIRDSVRDLNRDIDAGKEPDGQFPKVYASDRGKRVTLKVVRNRLHHIEFNLRELGEEVSNRCFNG